MRAHAPRAARLTPAARACSNRRSVTTRSIPLLGLLACAPLLACSIGGGQEYTTQASVSDGNVGPNSVHLSLSVGPVATSLVGGNGPGTFADGWSVRYTKALVTLGTVQFFTSDGTLTEVPADFVLDLAALRRDGAYINHLLLPSGAAKLEFTMPPANGLVVPHDSVTREDVEMMRSNGWSMYLEGSIVKLDGEVCLPDAPGACTPAERVTFRWGLEAGAYFSDCDPVETGRVPVDVALTLPLTSWFRTAFEVGDDAPLRAQWIADADLDLDGETTLEELQSIEAAALLSPEHGYDLSRAPGPIETPFDFLVAQARAIGRDAWGSCDVTAF